MGWPRRPLYPLPQERLNTTLQMLGGPGTGGGRTRQAQVLQKGKPGERTPDRSSGVDLDPVVVGKGATSGGEHGTAVGPFAEVDDAGGIALGWGAISGAVGAVSIGSSNAYGTNSVSVGSANANDPSGIAVGNGALSDATDAIAIGGGSSATADGSSAYGASATATGIGALALGHQAEADGQYSVAVGNGAFAGNDYEFALGTNNNIVIVNGKLVIADGSGGLHQIVVSTGGVLSTVAYP